MIKITYQSERYDPKQPHLRYVRFDASTGEFKWCLTCVKSMYDSAQGTCDESDLPPHIAVLARHRAGIFPSYVDWPVERDMIEPTTVYEHFIG